jgi:chromosome segregation ATPase
MTADAGEGRRLAAWLQALDFMDEVLARRLAETQEPPTPADDAGPAVQASLQTLDERLQQMQTRLEQAERDAAEADAVLRTEAEVYQDWTESTTAARRRLADWAANVK